MDPMEQIRKENIAKLSKYFTKHMVKMTSEECNFLSFNSLIFLVKAEKIQRKNQ